MGRLRTSRDLVIFFFRAQIVLSFSELHQTTSHYRAPSLRDRRLPGEVKYESEETRGGA